MILFGMTQIGLSVSSDRPDTDFTVKILDVYPDGRAFNIGDTILRMRYREGLEQPVFMQDGVIYDVTLPPIMLSR
jgi:predicted acyl esterase